MKLLVTGGAGFIGSHVVDQALAAGHEAAVVDNLSSGRRANLNPAAAFHEIDIRDATMAEVFAREKPDALVHLAAQMDVTRSVREPEFDAEVNVIGVIRLLNLCVEHKVKRVVFSSTGGAIYGAADDYPATEETRPEPLSPYAVSKFAGEQYLMMYSRIYGLTHVVLRYTNVFGPRQVPHGECGVCAVLTDLMLKGQQPTLYGFGDPVRDYVYVGDVARANVMALEKGGNTCMNICTGKPTTVMDIFTALRDITGFVEEPILKPLRPGEVEKSLASNARARDVLGWEPEVSLAEGLKRTVEAIQGG